LSSSSGLEELPDVPFSEPEPDDDDEAEAPAEDDEAEDNEDDRIKSAEPRRLLLFRSLFPQRPRAGESAGVMWQDGQTAERFWR